MTNYLPVAKLVHILKSFAIQAILYDDIVKPILALGFISN